MSLLSSLFGRRTPPPPPPTDALVLVSLEAGAGPLTLTLAVGERTYTAQATRRGVGPEYALHGIEEVVPEPEPEFETVIAEEAPDPRDIAVVRLPLTDADGSVVG